MSQQKIIDTLQNLGFSNVDAQVYLFLGKKGPKKVSDLVPALKIPKQQLYVILKNLQSRGIINATLEHPARFTAEPFEKVLDLFVKARMEEVQTIQGSRSQILTDWESIKLEEDKEKPSAFKVLEGKSYIYPKLRQIIEEAQTQLLVVLTIPELVQINQNQVLDGLLDRITESPVKLRILTDVSSRNIGIIHTLFKKKVSNLEIRVPDLGLKLPNSMVIRDNNEIAFMIDSTEVATGRRSCLWTNCEAIVQSFNFIFDGSWHNATDIYKKITEFKTGKPSPKTIVIKDGNTAKEKYSEVIDSAKESIFILMPSTELIDYVQKVDGWVRNGISVRIMVPILNENLESVRQIMKLCEIKHVPEGYLGTTIVDSQNLFQIKIPINRKKIRRSTSCFEDTIYSNDIEYVKKTECMLNNIWNNALSPSATTIESVIYQKSPQKTSKRNLVEEYKNVLGLHYIKEPQIGGITQKEIVDKIVNSQRTSVSNPKKDILKLFGYKGSALIYPQKELDLPNFLIEAFHHTHNSSFGETNTLNIYAQARVSNKNVYIPTGFITDNPIGYKFRTKQHRNRQTTEVISLLKKGQINIQLTNTGLFAGWTVELPLLPPKYVLPAASITLESTGEVQSGTSELIGPLQRRIEYEFNRFSAFINFVLPTKNYFGPASDGLLYRDFIMTSHPL